MSKVYFCVDRTLSRLFESYGRCLARYPIPYLVISLLTSGLLSIGIFWLQTENDIEALYTPQGNQAASDRAEVMRLFPTITSENFYPYQLPTLGLFGDIIFRDQDRFSQPDKLVAVSNTSRLVQRFRFSFREEEFNFTDVCAKRNSKCTITGHYVTTSDFQTAFHGKLIKYPVHIDSNGRIQDLRPYISNPTTVNGTLVAMEAVRLIFHLKEDNETQKAISMAWEEEFLKLMKKLSVTPFDYAFQSSQSINKELDGNTGGDLIWICLTFVVMVTYASLVMTGGDCVSSRGHLAFAGVFATCLAMGAAFGVLSVCGVKFVNIVGVAPFLALGKGIDDMFILMAGYRLTDPTSSTEQRVSRMFKTSAVPITVTTLTDLAAFGVSATSGYLSIRNFCIYTGVTLLFCYINMVVFFGACVVLHSRRVEQQRHQFTCRVVSSGDEITDRPCCLKFCCSGKRPEKLGDDDSPCEKAPSKWLPMIILNKYVKVFILLVFGCYIGFSIWGILGLQEGLDLKHLVSDGSYWSKFSDWQNELYTSRGPLIQLVITDPVNYWDPTVEQRIADTISTAQDTKYFLSDFSISWIGEYRKFLSRYYPNTTRFDRKDYIRVLRQGFLPLAPIFQNDVKISDDFQEIICSRVYIQAVGSAESNFQGQMMLTARRAAASQNLPMLAFSGAFIYIEQFVSVLPATLKTCAIAVGAMVVLGILFIPHPMSVVYIIVTMVMILTGLFGFMHIWDLTLSSITMILIVLSVGFCIDFSAHICHAFMDSEHLGLTRNERAAKAMEKVGVPIVNSAVSSILGIVLLVFAKSYIFQTFFKMLLLIITFGLAHSFLLLPVVLSYIGPPYYNREEERRNYEPAAKESPNAITPTDVEPTSDSDHNHSANHSPPPTSRSPDPTM